MDKRRLLSVLLCVFLVFSSIPAIKTSANSADSLIYQQDGVEVYYGVDSSWDGVFNAHFIIKNLSRKDIENWGIQFDFSNKISNIWNGKIISEENQRYIVKNLGYNQDIKKGSEVSFGFTATGDANVTPDSIALCNEEYVVEDGYAVNLIVYSDWGSGFSGAVELSNTGKEVIEDWTLEFDFNRNIDNMWNGKIIKHEGSRYVVKNADYNQKLFPGQSISIGFNGHQGSIGDETIKNVNLSSFGMFTKNNPIDVEEKVKIDTSELIQDEENIFYIPKDVYSISGTIANSTNATKLVYSSNNTYGLDIISGELVIGDNWTIENIPLIIGYNELTVTAVYNDNTVYSDTVIIANMYKDKTVGLEDLLVDSDMDGLEDYIEAIQGTDPLLKDTDGDGLSDYTELVDMGTDPFKKDTNDNGILDGDEDYDKDGLINKEEEVLGTLLYGIDSDYDGLTDYDEARVYFTNPILKDTDGDGASDGFEVENGYDPLQVNVSFTVDKEVEVGGTTYELQLTSSGENIESLRVEPINDSGVRYGGIAGYLDPAVDFKINGSFESAKLKVSFDETYLEIEDFVPALYYIDEENQEMVEIPGEWDGVSNYFYAELPHFSAYITLNKTNFIRVWENGIKAHAITMDGKTNLNIVFVTDLSGSMGRDRIYTLKESLNDFIGVLTNNDKAAIVSFTSYATALSELTSDKTALRQIVNSMSVGGKTAIYTGLDKAVGMLEDNDVDGFNMVILFTDGYDEPSTTYDDQYKSIVDRAIEAQITVHTVGIGTIDSELLTNIAHSTGGSFYYAENASTLKQQVTKVKKDVIDYTCDSNNDNISDYFTELLCDGKLITWDHQPVIISASYEDIQNDLDGDYDNDGLINGLELQFTTHEDQVISIIVNSNIEAEDTDEDSYTDYEERRNGTDPKIKDISEADFNKIIVNNGQYMASQASIDYINSDFTKFQLAIGNCIFNGKVTYVNDYAIALINFINVYNETVIEEKILKQMYDFLEQDRVKTVRSIVELTSSSSKTIVDLGEKAKELMSLSKEAFYDLESARRKLEKMSWIKFKEANVKYIAQRNKCINLFQEYKELDKASKTGMPEWIIDLSPKAKNFIKKIAKPVTIAAYTLDAGTDICNTYLAYSSLSAEFEQYEDIINFLQTIIENSEIKELREAANNVRLSIESEAKRFSEEVVASFLEGIETGFKIGEEWVLTNFGPYGWVAALGLAFWNMMSGTGALNEAALRLIAIGNSADIYAKYIRWYFASDNFTTYHLVRDDNGLKLLQLLTQLRIFGEDEAGRAKSEAGPLTKFIFWMFGYGQKVVESELKDRIKSLEKIGEKLKYKATGHFEDAYLKYSSGGGHAF